MTAEVAIINRSAVALAADSAVTITRRSSAKVYNTVNKLFTLSKFQPVAIMICGSADFMSVPWETIVKMYRQALGPKEFATIKDYCEDFERFITKKIPITIDDQKRRVSQIWYAYFDALNKNVHRQLLEAAKRGAISPDQVRAIFLAQAKAVVTEIDARPVLNEYKGIDPANVVSKYNKEFEAAKAATFTARGRHITPAINRALKQYAGLLIVRKEFMRAVSGLVFAGFGKDEIFPCVRCISCSGIIFDKLRINLDKEFKAGPDEMHLGAIYAFAQREMVVRYMEGVDERYTQYIDRGTRTLVRTITDGLILKYSAGTERQRKQRAARVKTTTDKMVEAFLKMAEGLRQQEFVKPVLEIVSSLPKEELAELAGALVNLTSLKRKISMDAETVGGPIDVAVISKGDGFVWIKRKHYFTPELNHFFMRKYLTDFAGGQP